MNRHRTKSTVAAPDNSPKQPDFQGYTLQDMRYHIMVNRLRIAMQKEKILMLVSPGMQGNQGRTSKIVSRADTLLGYADMAMMAYRIARKIGQTWQRIRSRD